MKTVEIDGITLPGTLAYQSEFAEGRAREVASFVDGQFHARGPWSHIRSAANNTWNPGSIGRLVNEGHTVTFEIDFSPQALADGGERMDNTYLCWGNAKLTLVQVCRWIDACQDLEKVVELNPNQYPGKKWRVTQEEGVYDFQPGNGTRYCLVYTDLGEGDTMITWLLRGDVGGKSFRFRRHMARVSAGYFGNKIDHGREADLAAILAFCKWKGADVAIPKGYDEGGCRV